MRNEITYKYHKVCGIYKITNLLTNESYIGSSVNLYARIMVHISQLERGIHHSNYLQRDYNKYGSDNFDISILELNNHSSENIKERELYYIKSLQPNYNSTTPITYEHSLEMRRKISKTMTEGYKDGSIIHPRLHTGNHYDVYNYLGKLTHSNKTCSECIKILNISNTSVIDNQIRNKGFGIFGRKHLVLRSGESISDYIQKVRDSKNISTIPLLYISKDDNIIYCNPTQRRRILKKVNNCYNYYSIRMKRHYFLLGTYHAVLCSNI